MTIATDISDAIELGKYGKFAVYAPGAFEILMAHAVSIEAIDTNNWLYPWGPGPTDPDVYLLDINIPTDFAAIILSFDWGNTDNDSRVYYELYRKPDGVEEYNVNYLDSVPGDFESCGVVTAASNDNHGVHPITGKQFQFRIWNRSASASYGIPWGAPVAAVDALVELAVHMYVFRIDKMAEVLNMSKEIISNKIGSMGGR